jgi:hypothetical protein
MPTRTIGSNALAKAKAAKQAAKLAEEAAKSAAAFRVWITYAAEHKVALSELLRPTANSNFEDELSGLLRETIAVQASIAEISAGAELAVSLSAGLRYLTARRAFTSDSEMAAILNVNRSQITRWKQGTPPGAENAERLVGLDVVVSLLDGFLEEASIPKWLRGTNAHLEHRKPLDVLREGRLSEVIRAIEAEKSGAFA